MEFYICIKCFIIWYWTKEVLLDGELWKWSYKGKGRLDQSVIREHILQIGIAWLVILSNFLWIMFITLYAYDRKTFNLLMFVNWLYIIRKNLDILQIMILVWFIIQMGTLKINNVASFLVYIWIIFYLSNFWVDTWRLRVLIFSILSINDFYFFQFFNVELLASIPIEI